MYASENLEFYEAAEALNAEAAALSADEFHARASRLYEEFISEFAAQEININSEMKTNILNELAKEDVETIDQQLFAPAQRFVYKLMEKAAWLSFTKTPHHALFVQHFHEQQQRQSDSKT